MSEKRIKRLDDYTDEELVEMTDAQLIDLIDLECAHAGVPLLPELPEKPDSKRFDPDMKGYSISVTLSDRAEAEALQQFVSQLGSRVRRDYVSGPSYKFKYTPNAAAPAIEEQTAYSPEFMAKYKTELEIFEAAEKRYEKAEQERKEIEASRSQIVKRINARRDEAMAREQTIRRYVGEYRRYLKLAMNEHQIARNFLVSAHSGESELIEAAIQRFCDEQMLGESHGAA